MSIDLNAADFNPAATPLPQLREAVWHVLHRATTDLNHGWRLPSLATICESTPQQRIVVLREVDSDSARIFAHTDVRSPKVGQLQANPQTSWLFYDLNLQIQLVISGTVQLHFDDELANGHWSRLSPTTQATYLGADPPGSVQEIPAPRPRMNSTGDAHAPGQQDSARRNFVVIDCQVTAMDLLFIRKSGNLRAHFRLENDRWKHVWLEP